MGNRVYFGRVEQVTGESRETGYGLDGQGSITCRGKRFSLLQCPDQLWGPPSLLLNTYWGLFAWGQRGQGMKLATHLHLVPSSRMVEL
jgi:hypothetical protein